MSLETMHKKGGEGLLYGADAPQFCKISGEGVMLNGKPLAPGEYWIGNGDSLQCATDFTVEEIEPEPEPESSFANIEGMMYIGTEPEGFTVQGTNLKKNNIPISEGWHKMCEGDILTGDTLSIEP